MVIGKDVSVFERMKQNLKDSETEIDNLKNRIKIIEEENQHIKKQRDEILGDCGFAIDYKALNAFSIERMIARPNGNYKYDYEVTNIGYIIDGKIHEWCFSCSREIHERLVNGFLEYMRIRNQVEAKES